MIVVVGTPAWRAAEPAAPAGRACEIALEAARAGSRVELVGRAGDDAAGAALLIALAGQGIGHVAMLRDPARATPIVEPAPANDALADEIPADDGAPAAAGSAGPRLDPEDVELGLQYLTGFDVLVVSDDAPPAVLPACVEAARFAGARLVVAVAASEEAPADVPSDATVLAAPDGEGEAFARLVGRYAAALDRGEAPGPSFEAARSGGWERPEA